MKENEYAVYCEGTLTFHTTSTMGIRPPGTYAYYIPQAGERVGFFYKMVDPAGWAVRDKASVPAEFRAQLLLLGYSP
jgi:hypothetical protein